MEWWFLAFLIVLAFGFICWFVSKFIWQPVKFRSDVDYCCGHIRNHVTEHRQSISIVVTKDVYEEVKYQLKDLRKTVKLEHNPNLNMLIFYLKSKSQSEGL